MAVMQSMDELGRLIIPRGIRDVFGWGPGTKLEVAISDITVNAVLIREISPCCSLCREESEDLLQVEKGYICRQCLAKVV